MAIGRFDLQGRTPYKIVMQYTPDISEYISFTWFQWCWYYDDKSNTKQLCQWLGPAHQTGQSFCSYINKPNGQFIDRSMVNPVPYDELQTDEIKTKTSVFMEYLNEIIGISKQPSFNLQNAQEICYTNFGNNLDDDNNNLLYGTKLLDLESCEINKPKIEALGEYINAQVVIPNSKGIPVLAKLKKRKRDADGLLIGKRNNNPVLESKIYDLEFPGRGTE